MIKYLFALCIIDEKSIFSETALTTANQVQEAAEAVQEHDYVWEEGDEEDDEEDAELEENSRYLQKLALKKGIKSPFSTLK